MVWPVVWVFCDLRCSAALSVLPPIRPPSAPGRARRCRRRGPLPFNFVDLLARPGSRRIRYASSSPRSRLPSRCVFVKGSSKLDLLSYPSLASALCLPPPRRLLLRSFLPSPPPFFMCVLVCFSMGVSVSLFRRAVSSEGGVVKTEKLARDLVEGRISRSNLVRLVPSPPSALSFASSSCSPLPVSSFPRFSSLVRKLTASSRAISRRESERERERGRNEQNDES